MKKFLLACSLIGMIAGANAHPAPDDQPGPRPGAAREQAFDPAARAAHLQKALQLSDEQTAKVKKVFEDSEKQRNALEAKYKPQFEAFHNDANKLREQTHTQLNGILTPKQKEALEAQYDRGRFHKRGGDHRHDDADDQHDAAPPK